MNSMSVLRELKSLEDLEKRVRSVHQPSEVLLREIKKRREELLNPPDHGAYPVVKPEVRK